MNLCTTLFALSLVATTNSIAHGRQEAEARPAAAAVSAAVRARIEVRALELLEDLRVAHRAPGLSAALVLPDGARVVLCAGAADPALDSPMTSAARLMQGSVGKTYFSAAAHHLRAAGELDFDAKVAEFFTQDAWYTALPNADSMTVRQLLRHQTGLARYVFHPEFFPACMEDPDRVWTTQQRLAFVSEQPARFAAGEGWSYSDTNFILLAEIIERVSGERAYDYIREHLLAPLELRDTIPTDRRALPGLVQGHAPASRGMGFPETVVEDGALRFNCQFEWGGGGFASSAEDLARWAFALYRGQAFEGEYLETMLDTVPARLGPDKQYGLGVMVRETALGPQIGHDGFFPGYTATMGYFPQVQVAAALMLNTDGGLGRMPLDLATERLVAIAAEELAGRGPLRVLSYNLHHGEGTDGVLELERIAQLIRRAAPDLVALQEVDRHAQRTGGVDQLAELARLTGMHGAFAKFMDFQGGEYGLALLSRAPIVSSERIELPPGEHEPRAVLAAEIDAPGFGRLRFVSLHLDWLARDERRFDQARALLEALEEVDVPVVLAGDFNDTPDSRTMKLLTAGFTSAPKPAGAQATFPSSAPEREIDYVLYRPAERFTARSRVLEERVASDHRPLLAELSLASGE